ncbi:MAG: dihydrolipoyl dehydrogenase [Candidatus Muiribacteriota bacterium]
MYDIAVIGGGPGGYVAAIYAALKGKKVILFEKDYVGGTCLNRGCIPTKTLLASAEIFEKILKADTYGIIVNSPEPDFKKIFERKNNVVLKLRQGIEFLLKKRKVDIISSKVELTQDKIILDESGNKYQAENIIIATGSVPVELPFMKTDGNKILNSNHALELDEKPESVVIVGGGVIGVEFAGFYSAFGVKTDVVEMASEILPYCDEEVGKRMKLIMKKKKVGIHTKTSVISYKETDGSIELNLNNGKTLNAEKVIVATGRKPVTESIKIDIEKDGNFIKTDLYMRTSVPGIYAIGDVTSKIQLAHVASAQALTAVNTICGTEEEFDYSIIPSCVYSHPEISWCGLTEKQAEEKYGKINKGYFRFNVLGRAQAAGEEDGFVKIISDNKDNILGVYIIGDKATELISESVLAMKNKLTVREWGKVMRPHPTYSEAVMEACHELHGECVHSV